MLKNLTTINAFKKKFKEILNFQNSITKFIFKMFLTLINVSNSLKIKMEYNNLKSA